MTGYVLYIFFLSYGHFSCSCSSISQIQGVADVDTPTHAIFRYVQTKKSMVKQSTIDTQSHPSLHTSFYTPPYTHCHCQHSYQPSHCPSHYPMTIIKRKHQLYLNFLNNFLLPLEPIKGFLTQPHFLYILKTLPTVAREIYKRLLIFLFDI